MRRPAAALAWAAALAPARALAGPASTASGVVGLLGGATGFVGDALLVFGLVLFGMSVFEDGAKPGGRKAAAAAAMVAGGIIRACAGYFAGAVDVAALFG